MAFLKKKIASAAVFLRASGLEMVKNSIQSVFDETGKEFIFNAITTILLFYSSGMKYETPIFCINDPESYELREPSQTSLPSNFKKETIEVLSHFFFFFR